jgi:hypothetical protein
VNGELGAVKSEAGTADWGHAGTLIEEMDAAGMAVELHRTGSKDKRLAWSFAARRQGDTISRKNFVYGETAVQAIERGHASWALALEAGLAE